MLTIIVPKTEFFDEVNEIFVESEEVVLELEHSLVSLSKWESKWEKPFLTDQEKTSEEVLSYVECMVKTPNFPPDVFSKLTNEHFEQINEYIGAKMSATWFNETPNAPGRRETITSELIYYWMIAFKIPMECEDWHLSRLFTLMRICSVKNEPSKKAGPIDYEARRRLNEQRRLKLGTTG